MFFVCLFLFWATEDLIAFSSFDLWSGKLDGRLGHAGRGGEGVGGKRELTPSAA